MINLTFNDISSFRNYINETKTKDFAIDLSNHNIFDSLRFLVLSSAYFYQKYPEDKLKCKVKSEDIKQLTSSFAVNNLEFI